MSFPWAYLIMTLRMREWGRLHFAGEVVEWLMAPVLKTGRAQALVGSNPTLSARLIYEY